jgi:hypothetical protein
MKRKRLMSAAILCTGVAMSVPRIPRHSRSSPSDSEAADSGGHGASPLPMRTPTIESTKLSLA